MCVWFEGWKSRNRKEMFSMLISNLICRKDIGHKRYINDVIKRIEGKLSDNEIKSQDHANDTFVII